MTLRIDLDETAWDRALAAVFRPQPKPAAPEPKSALDAILSDELEEPKPIGFPLKPVPPPYVPIASEPLGLDQMTDYLRNWVTSQLQSEPRTMPRLVRDRPSGCSEATLRRILQAGLDVGIWKLDRSMRLMYSEARV